MDSCRRTLRSPKRERMFDVADIPPSLWDSTHDHGRNRLPKGKLRLPTRLEEAYRQVLNEHNLLMMASDIDDRDSGPIGEQGEAGAHEHFAKRFSGSCGRIQLFALDPHHTFKTTRQALAAVFSGGKIRLLDIPLGAGAAAVELLSLVSQLRSKDSPVFPRIDLDVEVVGGELNPHAIAFSERLFQILKPWWLEHGINATLEAIEWDVLDDASTDGLVDIWKQGFGNSVVPAVVGTNFSGFLGDATVPGGNRRRIDEAESCLRHIFASASRNKAMTFWIEPAGRPANERFLPKLRSQVFARFPKLNPGLSTEPKSETLMHDPVVTGGEFTTRATGIHLQPMP
jgi:hypothetical protein